LEFLLPSSNDTGRLAYQTRKWSSGMLACCPARQAYQAYILISTLGVAFHWAAAKYGPKQNRSPPLSGRKIENFDLPNPFLPRAAAEANK
jgi:hypothetical protein